VRLGYELIREQLFFRKELIERLPWLIRLRWIAGAAGLAGYFVVGPFLPESLPAPLPVIFCGILLYNFVYWIIWRHLSPLPDRFEARPSGPPAISARDVQRFTIFAHIQIASDLAALIMAIYYSGGIRSPLLYFFIFHIILTGILLPPVSCYIYGLAVCAAMGGLVYFQRLAWSPLYPALIVVILGTAFLVTTVKSSLRTKGRELLHLSKALDQSNAKLTALYEMVKEMGAIAERQQLMDCATRRAAQIMGVKACSIKLMDARKKTLHFASTYGLSEDYTRSKESIDIQKSPINRKIIEGSVWAIGHIEENDYFQYPEDIKKEGITALICLPLRVERMVLGVFCVYGDATHNFSESDVRFFALMSDLTAIEIEKLNTQLNRNWFLQKSAHQLRSPLHTVASMLKTVKNGFLGTVSPEQAQTIARCNRRIEMMDGLIGDLLKLSMQRTTSPQEMRRPVYPQKVLQSLVALFEAEAEAKSVAIAFHVEDTLPAIVAGERVLDDLFTNLISNAIKYTPAGGEVAVDLRRGEGEKMRFEVRDTGIGIPEEALPNLFGEFFRAENAKAHTETGTGLGLAIVKELLDQLKGTISVESRMGEGSIFTCYIPIQ
jgi:K+-sensing histidine kinase KdpD